MDPPISLGDVTRSSLGRNGCIGELYDIRDETLSGVCLFNDLSSENLVQTKNIEETNVKCRCIEDIGDRLEFFDIETDIQPNIICGLTKPENAWSFLTKIKTLKNKVSCSLLCRFQTVHERLNTTLNESSIDLNALANPKYTHVISDIIRGAMCVIEVTVDCQPKQSKQEIRTLLIEDMHKIQFSLTKFGEVKCNLPFLDEKQNYVQIYSDLLPKNKFLSTLDDFFKLLEDVPALLREEGKAKPLYYGLTSLTEFRVFLNLNSGIVLEKIDDVFMKSVINLLKHGEIIMEEFENWNFLLKDFWLLKKKTLEFRDRLERLKKIIFEGLPLLKSGKKNLLEFWLEIEKFKNDNLDLLSYKNFLYSYSV